MTSPQPLERDVCPASSRYNSFPAYKPSGIKWFGDVPEHWEVRRSDLFVDTERVQIPPEQFSGKTVFHYSIPAVQEFGTGCEEDGSDIASSKQLITQPVLLVSKLNPRKSTVCVAHPHKLMTVCSTEFVPLLAKRCDLDFLRYLCLSEIFRQRLDSQVESVTRSHQRANPSDIYKFWSAWPPFSEQLAIGNFLDRETAKIDGLMAKKWELIEKLKEKRTALISHTVTRGLNPTVKLKHSGAPWVDSIPTEWECWKLPHICTHILDGTHFSPQNQSSGDYMYITAKNIRETGIELSDVTYVSAEDHDLIYRRCPVLKNDVLYIKDGATAGIAVVNVLDDQFSLLSSVAMLRPRLGLLEPRFLAYQLNSKPFKRFAITALVGGAMTRFTLEILSQFRLICPDYTVQKSLADFLDRETGKIEALVAKVETAIEKLQEYRTTLITAAVTGKIKVPSI